MPKPVGTLVGGRPSQSVVYTNEDAERQYWQLPRAEVAPVAPPRPPSPRSTPQLTPEEVQALAALTPMASHDQTPQAPAPPRDTGWSGADIALSALDLASIPASFFPYTAPLARGWQLARGTQGVIEGLSEGNYGDAALNAGLLALGIKGGLGKAGARGAKPKSAAPPNYQKPPAVKYAGPAPAAAVDKARATSSAAPKASAAPHAPRQRLLPSGPTPLQLPPGRFPTGPQVTRVPMGQSGPNDLTRFGARINNDDELQEILRALDALGQ